MAAKANPAIYPEMRKLVLQPRPLRPGEVQAGAIRAVLMDVHVSAGATASVMAAADGSASIYLSSGGGFIGGGQRQPQLRQAAMDAVALASRLAPVFEETLTIGLPPAGTVFFYVAGVAALSLAATTELELQAHRSAVQELWDAMQRIMTLYRTLPMGTPVQKA